MRAQSRPALCNTMDCSLPVSSLHGILQARILEWVAISSSRGSSPPRDPTRISCIGRQILYCWTVREAQIASGKLLYNTGCLAWLSVMTYRGGMVGKVGSTGRGDIYIYIYI